MNTQNKLLGAGFLTAAAASLCCIAPVLALVAGGSGLASTFSWLEPFRPYLVGFTVVVLVFAWYQKLKPKKGTDCDCEDEKPRFAQSKTVLALVSVFAGLMLALPLYAQVFYPKTEKPMLVEETANVRTVEFGISGMTCDGCAEHLNVEIERLQGIVKSTASYQNAKAVVEFDHSLISVAEIEKAINARGYKVIPKRNKAHVLNPIWSQP